MFNRQIDEVLYFSTKQELKINNVVYRPSICYKVPSLAKASLQKFEKDGKVVIYKTPVRFVNGAVVASPEIKPVSSVSSVAKEVAPTSSSRKKNK